MKAKPKVYLRYCTNGLEIRTREVDIGVLAARCKLTPTQDVDGLYLFVPHSHPFFDHAELVTYDIQTTREPEPVNFTYKHYVIFVAMFLIVALSAALIADVVTTIIKLYS